MDLREYLSDFGKVEKVAFAEAIGVKYSYLGNLMNTPWRCSVALALKIEDASYGAVTRAELRPDIFDPTYVTKPMRAVGASARCRLGD